jgi:polyphosphate kinase
MYLGSADLMPRNLDYRVEVVFPLLQPDLRERVMREVLRSQLEDTANAWEECPDGTYQRIRPASGQAPFDSQTRLVEGGPR